MPKKLVCQECGESGGEIEVILECNLEFWYDCDWCEVMVI
jgi:hypothetical protein